METYRLYHLSPLGVLQLESSDTAIHTVHFLEDADERLEERSHPLLQQCANQLDEYFAGRRRSFDLPLGQPGTTFQLRVWELLYQIPFGRTISYNDLARQYGDLKAIRAVASANGRNHLAIIVPCHRVIGSNRSLTGYAGGLWRKRWLLEHEEKHYHGVQHLFS